MKKTLIFIIINAFIWAENFEWSIGTGILNGVAHELVYKDSAGTKLSELIWGLENVPMFSFGLGLMRDSYNINGELQLNYKKAISEMDDYDWLINSKDWTHWSNSPTEIKRVFKLDLNYEYLLELDNFYLGALTGFKIDYYDWVASGGTFIYSNEGTGDRAKQGTFPNIPGISYNQLFMTPYIGLSSKIDMDKINFRGRIIYSGFVTALDKDIHHLRENGGMVFEGVFKQGKMLEIEGGGELALSENLGLSLDYTYSKYFTNRGYMEGYYIGTGEGFYSGYGSVGLDNTTSTISLALTYKF